MSNPREMFQSLNDSLNVAVDENSKNLTVSTYERKDVAPASEFAGKGEVRPEDIQDDYAFARAQLQAIAESGQEALQQALEAASATANPETFASVASLMKETADTLQKLIDLQKQIKNVHLQDVKIKQLSTAKKPGEQPAQQNNFFVGSTKDMIELIRSARESEAVIEGTFEVKNEST